MEAATAAPRSDNAEQPETPKQGSKPRTATKYAVSIWDEESGTFAPILTGREGGSGGTGRPQFKPYEGFKREDVLQDLIDANVLQADEKTGKTPWVQIAPISGCRPVRGTVEVVKPKIGLE